MRTLSHKMAMEPRRTSAAVARNASGNPPDTAATTMIVRTRKAELLRNVATREEESNHDRVEDQAFTVGTSLANLRLLALDGMNVDRVRHSSA